MKPTLRIYRDGALDRWATYKPLIVPALIKFRSETNESIDTFPERFGRMSDICTDYMYKLANQ